MRREKSQYAKTVSTRKGRLLAANSFAAMLLSFGATVTMFDRRDEREVAVFWVIGPHEGMAHFRGGSKVNSFLTHWFGDRKYKSGFGVATWTDVNPYHGCKATGVYPTLETMIAFTMKGIWFLKKDLEIYERINIGREVNVYEGMPWPGKYYWEHKDGSGFRREGFDNRDAAEDNFAEWCSDQYALSNGLST
jgi:hypothetical protein